MVRPGQNLTRLLLEAHRASLPLALDEGSWAVQPDHLMLGEAAAPLALAAYETRIATPVHGRYAVVVADRLAALQASDADVSELLARASRLGLATVARGAGVLDAVYGELLASPGRIVAACAPGAPSASAVGALPWRVDRLEAAALLANEPFVIPSISVIGLTLLGELAPWVSGADLALELARRALGNRPGAILELRGPGLERLAMRDRLALARAASALGVAAVLAPSDDVTRLHLESLGRDADWKRLVAEDEAAYDAEHEIVLDGIEPLLRSGEEPDAIRDVRHLAGVRVRRVRIGPHATYADVRLLVDMLAVKAVDPEVVCTFEPGSRSLQETLRAEGLLETLAGRGVRLAPGSGDRARSTSPGEAELEFGVAEGPASDPASRVFRASLESCAAAATRGCVTDPRAADLPPAIPWAAPRAHALPAIAPPRPAEERGAGPVPAPGRRGPPRGVVLLAAGDYVTTAMALPFGPRSVTAALDDLAAELFTPLDPQFAARARRMGGGWVTGGRHFLDGPRADLVAWLLARLGVRVVVARSLAVSAASALVNAGVLPLTASAPFEFETGDELELLSPVEELEPGKLVQVRHLTRGAHLLLHHGLGDRGLAVVSAGGLPVRAAGA